VVKNGNAGVSLLRRAERAASVEMTKLLGSGAMVELSDAALLTGGFCVVRNVIDAERLQKLIRAAETTAADEGRGGVRNLLDVPEFRAFAESEQVRELVNAALGEGAFAVRGILFDKDGASGGGWEMAWQEHLDVVKQGAEAWREWRAAVKADVASLFGHLKDFDLSYGSLREANLKGFDLNGCNLTGCDLSHADLKRASLRGARLAKANLS